MHRASVATALGLAAASGAIAGGSAGAASPAATATESDPEPRRQPWRRQPGLVESSRLIGSKGVSTEGQELGEIDQLVIEPRTGRITLSASPHTAPRPDGLAHTERDAKR